MKRPLHRAILLAAGPCLIGLHARAENPQPLPTPFPEIRYREMSAKSPFAVATAAGPAAGAPTPGFAAQLYVDGVARLGDTDFVAIKSRDPDKPTAVLIAVGQTTEDGLRVDGIRWSDEMGKSTVDVSKGGEKATLNFDQAQMAQNANAAPQIPRPVAAGVPMEHHLPDAVIQAWRRRHNRQAP